MSDKFPERRNAARRQADKDLALSEERYRLVVENANDIIWKFDLSSQSYSFISPAVTRILGYSVEEAIKMQLRDVYPPETLKKVMIAYGRLIKGEITDNRLIMEAEHYKKDGSIVLMEVSSSPIFDDRGKITGMAGVTRDITERKRAEEDLRKSEQRYRDILETMREGYFELDLEGNYTFANESNCRFLGYTKEELLGKNFRMHTSPEEAAKITKPYRELYKTGKPIAALELESFTKDGRKVIHETSVSLIRDEKGKPVGFRGVSRDVTARKMMEEDLRRREEKMQSIFRAAPIGIGVIIDRVFVDVNDRFCEMTGYNKEEVIGQSARLIYPTQEEFDYVGKEKYRQISEKGTGSVETRFKKKDGTIIDILLSSTPIDPTDLSRGVTFTALDISERKKTEDDLRKSDEKYRSIMKNMQEGYFEVDLGGNLTFVNQAMCANLGYSEKELIGMNFRQYTSEETARKLFQVYNKIFKTGQLVKTASFEFIRKDKTKIYSETSASLIVDNQGKPVGFRGVSRDVTERKQMEDALRESEEKYRTILESIDDGYYEIDLEGNYTFFNDAEARNLGYSREEMMGMNSRKYQDNETYKRTRKAFIELYRTGIPIKALEMEAIRKDGTKVFNEISASLMRDQQGKPIGFRGITRNISERKKAEAALRESEKRYRFLTESMTDIVWIAGLDLSTIYVTPSIQRILGFTQEERMRQSLSEQLTPESLKLALDTLDKELALEKQGGADPARTLNIELEYYHKDGSTRWLDMTVSGIRDNQGVLTSIYGVARDITERKLIEDELSKSEEKYRTVLDEMEEGYFELDLNGNGTFYNDAICRIFGYSRAELQNINYKQFMDKENAEKRFKVYNEIYKTGNKADIQEYEIIRKDGTKRYLETSASPRRDSAGKIIGFRGISRDITERKLAENELKTSRDELINKNKEIEESRRNVQITLEKLGQAYEELKTSQAKILQQEKMASIGQLAAGVAHEINNPVAFIASNLNTLDKYTRRFLDFLHDQEAVIKSACAVEAMEKLEKRRKELKIDYIEEDVNKLLRESLDGTGRVQKIVRQLTRFSRVDDADYLEADINEVMEQSVNIVWNELKYKAALHKNYGKLPITKCFPQQISQVFINLLLNAFQAIPEKGEIKIKTWQKNNEIFISVSDTGVGISSANIGRLFEPFFTTKEVGKGTGLGLSISYEIIQRHKGDISVESKEGKGTTFTVRIPVVS
ncbi:MAG TPA: PAS domain S-box protein [Smithellaceae bacterium]|nr:PAS domain S-box protein [Smithellaceae bacterium]HRS89321.1 PAS domain S-box protein [Smithellaceae bacterium]HRV25191.1 PAS domain S-box protein [Smithellaceae bacterium]